MPWVSTDLRILRPEPTWRLAPDCEINDRCYRKLDPEYLAWLRRRMLEVKAAHKAGRAPQVAFDELRTPFNELQENAIALFGEKATQEAMRAMGAPSTAHLLPMRYRTVLAQNRRHSPRLPFEPNPPLHLRNADFLSN